MTSSKIASFNLDFSDVNKLKFKCLNNCAKCCYDQNPILTSIEINRIRKLIKKFDEKDIKNIIYKMINYLGIKEGPGQKDIEIYHKIIKSFWYPYIYEETKEFIIIKNYILYNIGSSKCIFLDDLKQTCFIYPSRPYTCKLYPISFEYYKESKNKVVIDLKNCPGIGIADKISIQKIEIIQKHSFNAYRNDMEVYNKYIRKEDLKLLNINNIRIFNKYDMLNIFRLNESKHENNLRNKNRLYNKKIIEPLFKMGLITEHPIIKMFNKAPY